MSQETTVVVQEGAYGCLDQGVSRELSSMFRIYLSLKTARLTGWLDVGYQRKRGIKDYHQDFSMNTWWMVGGIIHWD